jgi:hypothetical protein
MQETVEHDLIQSLQTMIAAYLERNPQLTLNALAQRSNVPVTTLRRLAQGQQKNEIAPHSVLNLVSYVLREKSLARLLERVGPAVADFLRRHFGSFIFEVPAAAYSAELNAELRDQTKYLIYKLAANHDGTDLIAVAEAFGSFGLRKVEELKALGLLEECGGRLHARDKNFSLDLTVAAAHLPALVAFYKPETMARGLNTMFSMSEALTREAVAEIKALQRECVLKMNAVMNRPESRGTIPYFTLNLGETLLADAAPGDLQ